MLDLLLLLIPIAAVSGWYGGYRHKSSAAQKSNFLPRDYFIGLKYLIDEQPDKAVDIFIKMLEVNSDTVETHLALGGLFRRRGEVNRAIRVHQNLIARPQLVKGQRVQALSELAQDYMRAGVLDRAEKLFLELLELDKGNEANFRYLLHIYEQQKDWEQAITIAKRLHNMQPAIAHYYCELGDYKKALLMDKNCVRATLLQGNMYINDGDFRNAIRVYKKVKEQDADFISEVINPLAQCYEQLSNEHEFIDYLQNCLYKFPCTSIILALAKFIKKYQNDVEAIKFITEQINEYPSMRALDYLTELYINNADDNAKHKFLLLQKMIRNLAADKPIYHCIQCGFSARNLYWQCPACKRWNSVKPRD